MSSQITLAMSLLETDLENNRSALDVYFAELDAQAISWLLVVQTKTRQAPALPAFYAGRTIFSHSLGLSKSRNIALAHCQTRYAIFTDYDTRHNPQILLKFERILLSHHYKFPFVITDVGKTKDWDRIAQFASRAVLSGDGLLIRPRYQDSQLSRIFSVQICWDVEFLKRHDLSFDENLGLGNQSWLPGFGEEYLLALNCYFRSGQYGRSNRRIALTLGPTTGDGLGLLDKLSLFIYILFHLNGVSLRQKAGWLATKISKKALSLLRQ